MLDNVGHMWGFITVIAVGLVDSYSFLAWIQAILWFRFGSFAVQCIVDLCVSSHESSLGECFH
jgi:hypothetical protein